MSRRNEASHKWLLPPENVGPLVSDKLLQSAPCNLEGLSSRVANHLFIMTKKYPWSALACRGLPNPKTVADLLKWRPASLLSFPRFGRKAVSELVVVLADHGLRLAPHMWETSP